MNLLRGSEANHDGLFLLGLKSSLFGLKLEELGRVASEHNQLILKRILPYIRESKHSINLDSDLSLSEVQEEILLTLKSLKINQYIKNLCLETNNQILG